MRRTLSAVMVILLLAGIFTSLLSIQPIRGSRPNDTMTSETLFPYFIDVVILDVNVSLYETVPGPIIHIYVTFEATWDVFDFSSFWVEAFSNSSSIDWKMFIVLWSGHDTFTVDFTWNTSGVEVGSYLISVWTSTMSYYEDGIVRILQTITVPDDYPTIQEAINAANEGDTVFVRNGTYFENVVVNKTMVLTGESSEETVVDGGGVGTVIQVNSDGVTISGFQLINCSMESGNWGIALNHSSKSVIEGNVLKAVYAIGVIGGSENSVKDNDFVGHDGSCVFSGLQLVNSSDNIVSANNLSLDCHSALTMRNSSNNRISSNYISGHFVPFPFSMEKSDNNSIVGNIMWQPAPLFGGHMHFTESKGNVLYHNSFLADEGSNMMSIDELSTNNTWDNGCEGNYWSDYAVRYPNASSDQYGIWNTSYVIDVSNIDRSPLRSLYWNPADVNHDLIVNIFDIALAAPCYCIDWEDHMCHVDIAEPYGTVDIFDIVLMAGFYGEEYEP